ncbi:MAG: NmrA family transcriptional regulator [Hyphomicrobiales bacterium]|nr:MAG: NmrA family transcriptional regulator [Hyphomicrobiales bacterium]
MKIVVIGGSGRIGEKLVYNLRQDDFRVLEASPSFGVNTVTGEGLEAALTGANVVADVSNSPSLEGDAPLRFFETSGRNLLAAGRAAGVGHHIALSVVGTDRLTASSYFRAKKIQEDLIKASTLPYTILRSTPFFEVISAVAQEGTSSDVVISPAWVRPIAAEDLAQALADTATGDALNRTIEVAGPERFRFDYLATEVLTAYEDPRRIISDPHALYFGAELDDQSLEPGPAALIATLRFEDWLRDTLQPEAVAPRARKQRRA